ncbi:hydrogenase subunit MbhD domain-containing protein [Halobacteriota archaeon]
MPRHVQRKIRGDVIMIWVLDIVLLILLVITAIAVVISRDLLVAAVIFAVYSLIMAVVYVQLNSPDVGLTEAAVGAGVTTVLFILAIARTARMEEDLS